MSNICGFCSVNVFFKGPFKKFGAITKCFFCEFNVLYFYFFFSTLNRIQIVQADVVLTSDLTKCYQTHTLNGLRAVWGPH